MRSLASACVGASDCGVHGSRDASSHGGGGSPYALRPACEWMVLRVSGGRCVGARRRLFGLPASGEASGGEGGVSEMAESQCTIAEACRCLLRTTAKPTVPLVLPLVQEYVKKPGNMAGGSLHVVLEDCNLEDDFVRGCVGWAWSLGDTDGEALGEVLLRMSKTQRRVLCRRRFG